MTSASPALQISLPLPSFSAEQPASWDFVLSGGRLDLGVGVGWQKEEYEAAGLDFAERGALLNDTLAACQTLWTQQRAAHKSEHLSFEAIHMMPKPAQPGGVPIWVSSGGSPGSGAAGSRGRTPPGTFRRRSPR